MTAAGRASTPRRPAPRQLLLVRVVHVVQDQVRGAAQQRAGVGSKACVVRSFAALRTRRHG
jgi:hypothetical protein